MKEQSFNIYQFISLVIGKLAMQLVANKIIVSLPGLLCESILESCSPLILLLYYNRFIGHNCLKEYCFLLFFSLRKLFKKS